MEKVLITGASGGIGSLLINHFARTDMEVYGTYNSTPPRSDTQTCCYSKIDLSNDNQVCEWIKETCNSDDKIVLINCAGINYNTFAHKADVKKWMEVININLGGAFRTINAVLPIMRNKGYGRIINFSSIVAQKGISGTSAYASSKAALWGLAKSIAAENASKGITINNLNLGYFDIGMTSSIPEKILSKVKESIPSGMLGNSENIINAVLFLIKSDYINGSSIDINGGLI